MKRQFSNNRSWPRKGRLAAVLAAAGFLFAACNEDPASDMQGQPLPAGAYPLSLTAFVTPATRATTDDAWTGGEQVAVEAAAGDAPAAVKTYMVAANGALSAADAADRFWWTSTDERKTLRAWYCGDGSSAAGAANGAAVPAAWRTAADQSGAEGCQASELLFAPAVTASFGNAAVPLRFYHQTAKVLVYIKNAEYVTDAAQILSVRIGAENLALSGEYEAPAGADATAGIWTPGAAEGEIVPRRLATAPAGCVAGYEALVIPQSMDGERLVAVETAVGTMYYTPKAGDAQLAAGKVHTYNITVRADRLEVEVVHGGSWNDGGSDEVGSYVAYSASDLKLGDYYYSDGSISDGGLRGVRPNGTLRMAAVKPAPENGKTLIGIVFQTDPARVGKAETEALKEKGVTARGLVMAVKNTGPGQLWSTRTIEEGLPRCVTAEDNYNDISGYGNCEKIRQTCGGFDKHPAFKAADEYNKTCPAPATTTGWYLPASGQWYDLLRNLGGLAGWDEAVGSNNTDNYYWFDATDALGALNTWMAALAPEAKDEFAVNVWFWCSSEVSEISARGWMGYERRVYCNSTSKGLKYRVRPVLAF